ncbi:MAG: hypothetical protein QW482_08330, partial [Thermoproteota archaeon]
ADRAARLAWLSPIPIAVGSGRINRFGSYGLGRWTFLTCSTASDSFEPSRSCIHTWSPPIIPGFTPVSQGTPFQCGPEYIEADAYLSVSKHVNDRLKRLRNRLGRPPFLKPYSPVEDEEDVAACFKQPSTLRLKYHRRPPSLYEDSNSVGRHPP